MRNGRAADSATTCRSSNAGSLPLVFAILLLVILTPAFVVHVAATKAGEAEDDRLDLKAAEATTPAVPGSSRFNSLGKTRQYIGSIDGLTNLTQALDSCSYQREIVLIATTEAFVDAAVQTVGQLQRQGISHIIITSTSQQACANISLLSRGTCCVWSNPRVPEGGPRSVASFGFHSHRLLMTIRLSLAARALRLRYNILFLDTDIIIFDDPYKYFKQPPFSRAQLLLKGGSYDVNIGVMYVQNASPDGPVAWVFAEVLDRLLRWAEAPETITARSYPNISNLAHVMWDQTIFSDALFSAVLGRPIFQGSWTFQNEAKNLSWLGLHQGLINRAMKASTCRASRTIQRLSRLQTFKLGHAALHRPFTSGRWPEQLGGRAFAPRRGELSQQWQETLRESGEPLWPDPDDPACHRVPEIYALTDPVADASTTAADSAGDEAEGSDGAWRKLLDAGDGGLRVLGNSGADAGVGRCPGRGRSEVLMLLPKMLVTTWTSLLLDRETEQDWSAKVQPPTQVIGHVVYLPSDKRIYKTTLKMSLGHYDWSLVPPARPFFASTPALPVPRVLAASTQLLEQLGGLPLDPLLLALRSLFTAAAAAGRALVWPTLPCAALRRIIASMAGPTTPQARARLLRSAKEYFQVGAVPYPLADTLGTCLWGEYLYRPCLERGVGLLAPEFAHLQRTLPRAAAQQSAANTLQLPPPHMDDSHAQGGPSWAAACGGSLPSGKPSADPGQATPPCPQVRNMTLASYMEHSRKVHDQPVVWLDALPLIIDFTDNEGLRIKTLSTFLRCWAIT